MRTKLGDVWTLGEITGSCAATTTYSPRMTRRPVLDGGYACLMVTDPPYGVNYDP